MEIDTELIEKLRSALESADLPEDTDIDALLDEKVIGRMLPILAPYLQTFFDYKTESDNTAIEKINELFQKATSAPVSGDDIRDLINNVSEGFITTEFLEKALNLQEDNWLINSLLAAAAVILQIAAIIPAGYEAESEKIRQIINKDVRPYLLDLDTITKLYYRKSDYQSWVQDEMARMGISDEKISLYLEMQKQLLSVDVIRFLYNRGFITDDEVNNRLKKLQFDDNDIETIKQTFNVYPGVQDLVRFAVREAFSPELAQSLGLYEDMPDDFLDEAQKQGLKPEYAKMYWAAHWTPPPITQAFEMFHRGIITESELKDLLRINDYVPNYRDKLIEIAYNPITRVDLRRIYQDGMISFEELVNGYLDLGYSPENAELIAEWVDARYGEERKNLTKSNILKLYKYEAITRTEAAGYLQELGYSEEDANYLLTAQDLQEAERIKNRKLRALKKAWMRESISQATIKAAMGELGMSAAEIADITEDWEVERESDIKYLSKDDILKLYQSGIITRARALEKLNEIGYRDEDAELLLRLK